MSRDHPLSLPTGTVLAAVSPDSRSVEYLHIAIPGDQLDPAGVLTGDGTLTAAVMATLDGSNEHIDGDDELVWLRCLTEQHPTGISTVVPCMRWFLMDRDTLPDMAIAITAVMPAGSVLNAVLDGYLRAIEEYGDDCARDAELGVELRESTSRRQILTRATATTAGLRWGTWGWVPDGSGRE